ncbi:MAG: hypothetical protein ABSA42_15770 [Terracidiphilus sp.]
MRMLLLENGKLLPQNQVFQKQITARANQSRIENGKEPQMAQLETSFTC